MEREARQKSIRNGSSSLDGNGAATIQDSFTEVGGAAEIGSLRFGSPSKIEEVFTVEQFQQLMGSLHRFSKGRQTRPGMAPQRRGIPSQDFRAVLAHILGIPSDDERITALCNEVDTDGTGFIKEEEFCSYILQQLRERDSLLLSNALPFQDPPLFHRCLHSKETLLCLNPATNPQRYISVSKDGMISSWSPSLQLQRGCQLQGDPLLMGSGSLRGTGGVRGGRRGNLWVTDGAVMSDCSRIVIATTSCELAFYDMTTFQCKYRLHDLPYVPLCLDYHSNSESSSPSRLLYGDVAGSVVVLTFLHPSSSLFHCPSKEEDDTLLVPFARIGEHRQFVALQVIPQVHGDWVRRVAYTAHNRSFISCSACPSRSLVFRDVLRKNKSYVFRIRKGVLCFDYCHQLDVLVTGSLDHVVRVWNPYVPSKPMARLTAHRAIILDILIARHSPGLLFSFSQDSVLCAWDMFEHTLVQTISVKFPFIQRLPDYGPSILSLLPPSHPHTLTILCNEYIAKFELGSMGGGANQRMGVVSHKHPLCTALYNPLFKQVVSGCEGGEVKVWSVEGGSLVLRLADTHGTSNELTAMSFDASGRRLLTGSRGGDAKVWNYREGVCLKHLSGFSGTEVTGVKHLLDKGRFLAVGWNRRITTFPDDPDSYDVKSDVGWQGDDHHSDDILCVAYAPPYYLATGSFDGSIKIWNLDTEKLVSQFQSMTKMKTTLIKGIRKASLKSSRTPLRSSSSLRSSGVSFPSRPASRRLSAYRIRSNSSLHAQHVPVDAMLFLQSRMAGAARLKGTAVLVTSEAGHAHFWDIFGSSEPMSSFPLTELDDEQVLALTTDPLNTLLVAGDTAGFLSLFPISPHYCRPNTAGSLEEHCSTSHGTMAHTARWRAHAGEVLSVEYVSHEARPLVLSSSGDCTVRLWTLEGHFIGTFGQEQPWSLSNPASFQHPRTPWGEMKSPLVMSAIGSRAITPAPMPHSPVIPVLREVEFEGDDDPAITDSGPAKRADRQTTLRFRDDLDSASSPHSNSAISTKVLGAPYKEGIKRRMVDRLERRSNFAEIDSRLTGRFGSLCSPYQALHMPPVSEVTIPQQLSSVLDSDTT